MTRNVWGCDSDFIESNSGQVERIAVTLLHKLAKLELKADRPQQALRFLDEAKALNAGRHSPASALLTILARTPKALALAKQSKRILRDLRR
jgi:hypothetical protein